MRKIALILSAALLSGPSLLADFSYDQTSKITGGMMAGMMKFAGAFSKKAREPIKTSIVVKGDRMANLSADSAQIIDLGKETVTHVDFQKKTYSVLTFAEYAKALEQLNAKMAAQKGEKDQPQMTATASVKETGEKRNIAGFDARQFLLTVDMQGTDKDTGKTATIMTMTDEMWVAPSVAGYNEVREFYQKMSQKLNWAPSFGMMAPQGSSKGMAEMMKEMSKIDGVPVYQVVKMGGMGTQGAAPEAGEAGQQPPPQREQEAEAEKSSGGALGRIAGGRFGGLGGFGRKKKKQEEQPPAPAEQPAVQSSGAAATPPPQQAGGAGALMEVTIESSNFSTASVDAAKLEVPAGFKQVESEMLKAGR